MDSENNKNILIVGVFVAIAFTFCLVYSFLNENWRNNKIKSSMPTGQDNIAQNECPEGWNFYKQDVVGISFCYPKEWGDLKSDPTGPITRLDNLSLDGYETGSIYNNNFTISFSNINNRLTFFNNNFGSTEPSQYTSNAISSLISSGDICNFTTDRTTNPSSEEVYNACDKNVKTAFINEKDYDPSGILQFFAYKKLQNGYFDNLLISHVLERKAPMQFTQRYNNIDDVLSQIGKSKDNFMKEKTQFETFAGSIKIFSPVQPQKKDFENVTGEDARITAIRKYYWLISNGKLDEAYAMETNREESYENFANNYADVYSIEACDFKNVGNNEFSFSVFREDNNNPIVKYKVNMLVSDGKLKTTFIEKIVSEEIKSNEYAAFSVIRGNKACLILKEGDKEIVIDQEDVTEVNNILYENKPIFHCPFSSIKFSSDSKYLFYTAQRPANSRDEGLQDVDVYDVKSKKLAFRKPVGDDALIFGFAPDEKSFYLCANPGYSGKVAGEIYSVPQFQKIFDAFSGADKDYLNVGCEYKQDKGLIIFTLMNLPGKGSPNAKEIQYNLNKPLNAR